MPRSRYRHLHPRPLHLSSHLDYNQRLASELFLHHNTGANRRKCTWETWKTGGDIYLINPTLKISNLVHVRSSVVALQGGVVALHHLLEFWIVCIFGIRDNLEILFSLKKKKKLNVGISCGYSSLCRVYLYLYKTSCVHIIFRLHPCNRSGVPPNVILKFHFFNFLQVAMSRKIHAVELNKPHLLKCCC